MWSVAAEALGSQPRAFLPWMTSPVKKPARHRGLILEAAWVPKSKTA